MEDKKYFTNGVEYYIQFDGDDPIKLAESTEQLDSPEAIERSTLTLTVEPAEDSKLEWKVSKKKFKIFAKEKE
jgi:hypothetical protein